MEKTFVIKLVLGSEDGPAAFEYFQESIQSLLNNFTEKVFEDLGINHPVNVELLEDPKFGYEEETLVEQPEFKYRYDFERIGDNWGHMIEANSLNEAHEKFLALGVEELRGENHEDFVCTQRRDNITGAGISVWQPKGWEEQE